MLDVLHFTHPDPSVRHAAMPPAAILTLLDNLENVEIAGVHINFCLLVALVLENVVHLIVEVLC